MSQKEISRLEVFEQVASGRMSQVTASSLLKLGKRQVIRLYRRYRQEGPAGLISKRRGRASNNRLSDGLKTQVAELVRKHYYDFGPTLAHEKLSDIHGIRLSVESTRKIMIAEGIWKRKNRKCCKVHPMRERRACFGELVQIDGSLHHWFEDRGPRCCLLVFIDDATGRLVALRFVEEESTQGYFDITERYLQHHGRPVAFYSDKHGVFRVNIAEAKTGTGETQFGRAMRELGIELICAHSAQAKGRVERSNKTLQDRLVKEMRLQSIDTIAKANRFLPAFIEDYNKRFAIDPVSSIDAHRKALPLKETLTLIFSFQQQRTLSKNLETSYQNIIYQVQTDTPSYTMRRAKIIVCDRKGRVTLLYKNKSLRYKTIDKHNRPAPVVTGKALNNTLTQAAASRPKKDHPWRQSYQSPLSRMAN